MKKDFKNVAKDRRIAEQFIAGMELPGLVRLAMLLVVTSTPSLTHKVESTKTHELRSRIHSYCFDRFRGAKGSKPVDLLTTLGPSECMKN